MKFIKIKNLHFVLLFFFSFVFINSKFAFAVKLDYLSALRKTNLDIGTQKDYFLSSLAREYKSFALYKAAYTNDFNGANNFAKKALQAHTGTFVKPINIYSLNLPSSVLIKATNLYDDFIFLFDNALERRYPLLMAEAQSKFDCWIDSEMLRNEKRQAKGCFQRFKKAMDYLYEKLDKVCDTKCQLAKRDRSFSKKNQTDILPDKKNVNNLILKGLKHKPRSSMLNKDVEIFPLNGIRKPINKSTYVDNAPFIRPIEKEIKTNSFVADVKKQDNSDIKNLENSLKNIENTLLSLSKRVDGIENNTNKNLDIAEIKMKIDELSSKLNSLKYPVIAEKPISPANVSDLAKEAAILSKEVVKETETVAETNENANGKVEVKENPIIETGEIIDNNNEEIIVVAEDDSGISESIEVSKISDDISTKITDDNLVTSMDKTDASVISVTPSAEITNKNIEDKTDVKTLPIETEIEKDEEEEVENKDEEETKKDSDADVIQHEKINDDKKEIINEEIKKDAFTKITENDSIETEVIAESAKLLPYELFFDWDKADVKSKYNDELEEITNKALKSKEMIVIQGHTDASGTAQHNQILSDKRAENVGNIVMSYGIPKDKIILQGVGSTDPKVPNKPGERKAENRRVVIK